VGLLNQIGLNGFEEVVGRVREIEGERCSKRGVDGEGGGRGSALPN